MGDIINLRQARKRFARKAAEDKAAENRALHGLSKAEKLRIRQETNRLKQKVDSARIETAATDGGHKKADRKEED